MLILTRRLGESVKIGDEVTVTVLGVHGPHVRLGFAAPKEVAVHREELYGRLHASPIDIAGVGHAKFLRRPARRDPH